MKKLKVLFTITQAEWGGAQKYVFDLAANLNKDRYEVVVAAGSNETYQFCPLLEKLKNNDIRCRYLKYLVRNINPIKDFLAFWELWRLIRKEKPDFVLLNSTKAGILGAPAGFFAGCKNIIFTAHGFVFNEPSSWLKRQFYILATKFSTLFLKKIITVSHFDYQSGLKAGIKPQKMTVIHNGIDLPDFLSKEEAKNFLGGGELVVGTAAYFYSNKGLGFLIKATALIKKNFKLVIVGDGEQRSYLESLIKKHQLDNVFLVGEIKDAYRYFKAFDIFALPSVKEGLPFVLLEAMAAGLPVVASKVGGVPEVIEDGVNGLLVEPTNVEELADALLCLLADPLKRKGFGDASLAKVKKEFSFEKMVKETEGQLKI